jgi:hypothetical protein
MYFFLLLRGSALSGNHLFLVQCHESMLHDWLIINVFLWAAIVYCYCDVTVVTFQFVKTG